MAEGGAVQERIEELQFINKEIILIAEHTILRSNPMATEALRNCVAWNEAEIERLKDLEPKIRNFW